MGSYYYLASQLPYLTYGQKPPMLPEAFMNLAKPLLSGEDAALLGMVSLDPEPPAGITASLSYADKAPPSGSEFIDGWREWERAFRLNLARQRAVKAKREGTPLAEPPVVPADAASAASRAVAAMESPLEAETLIDKARWNAIDALQGYDSFGSNAIFAYMLKLLILERRASFQTETGFSEYKSLYASILESAQGVSK